jgi:hypothetical protein
VPKVVVYVKAEDARTIEAVEQKEVDKWVRELVQYGIAKWHEQHAEKSAS